MKLLLDQNLSHRVVKTLLVKYPGTTQVSFIGLEAASDKAIWDCAQSEGYAIATLDADFHEYSLLWGGPPLIIWLKCGNQPKATITSKLIDNYDAIVQADNDEAIWCIEVY